MRIVDFPHCVTGLRLERVAVRIDSIEVHATPPRASARCPTCHRPSRSVHSRYTRSALDLPWSGLPVTLYVRARRFRCRGVGCPRRIFCERLPVLLAPRGRRTRRLLRALQAIGRALGGRPGARLAATLQVRASRMTLLRLVRALPEPMSPTPQVLGVDEWAFRRGRRYGTLLVDLDRHRAIDLLPEATGEAFATWLRSHPGIIVVSRDRGGIYAEGVRQGAPQAVQVADRFHLLNNCADVVERVLRRHAALISRVPAPEAHRVPTRLLRPDRRASRERTQRELDQRYAAIHRALARGLSISATARALGLHRHTVQKYRALTQAPVRRHTWRRPSNLAPYQTYLQERWQRGRCTAMGLWREIRLLGYPGAYQNVARFVAVLRKQARTGETATAVTEGMTARRARGLALTRPQQRTPREADALERVKALHAELDRAVTLLERFAHLLRHRTDQQPLERLTQWESDATATAIPELVAFVAKLAQDHRAVEAALTEPYSQGQTEGQITRLKLLKRAMYGRANFDLLRKRFLAPL
jgi:transposase